MSLSFTLRDRSVIFNLCSQEFSVPKRVPDTAWGGGWKAESLAGTPSPIQAN